MKKTEIFEAIIKKLHEMIDIITFYSTFNCNRLEEYGKVKKEIAELKQQLLAYNIKHTDYMDKEPKRHKISKQ